MNRFRSTEVGPRRFYEYAAGMAGGIAVGTFVQANKIRQLKEDNSRLNDELAQARERADIDDKTGMLKPTVFEQRVSEFTSRIGRAGDAARTHAFILGDLDKFHDINAVLGYAQADNTCLIPVCRKIVSDLRGRDMAGRFGGEELMIFLADVDMEQAEKVGRRIQSDVNEISLPQPIAGRDHLGISMGVVLFDQGVEFGEVFNRANFLVSAVKDGGRNQVMFDRIERSEA